MAARFVIPFLFMSNAMFAMFTRLTRKAFSAEHFALEFFPQMGFKLVIYHLEVILCSRYISAGKDMDAMLPTLVCS